MLKKLLFAPVKRFISSSSFLRHKNISTAVNRANPKLSFFRCAKLRSINCKAPLLYSRGISNDVLARIKSSKQSLRNSMQTLERGTDEEGQPLTSDDYAEHSRNISDLKPLLDAYDKYVKYEDEINELDDLVEECEDDKELRALAIEDKQKLQGQVEEVETLLMELLQAKDSDDSKNVILEVRSGAGGTEAALFAKELFEMYEKYAGNKGWNFKVLSKQLTSEGTDDGHGYSNAAAQVVGQGAFGRLKYESGVHRVQRVPTTEKQGRIQTSTAAILILPEAKEADVDIKKGRFKN